MLPDADNSSCVRNPAEKRLLLHHASVAQFLPCGASQRILRAGCRNRTDDIFFTREVLYQLS